MQHVYTKLSHGQCARMTAGIHKRQHTVQGRRPQHDMPSVIVGKETPKPKLESEDVTLIRNKTENVRVDSLTRVTYQYYMLPLLRHTKTITYFPIHFFYTEKCLKHKRLVVPPWTLLCVRTQKKVKALLFVGKQ